MPIIERPNFALKVEQTKSTFAEGNARWYTLLDATESDEIEEYKVLISRQDEQRS